MHRTAALALVALISMATPPRAAAQYSNLDIPTAAQGYSISTSNNNSDRISGEYTGETETMDELAVGREPDVIGRMYKSHFMLTNRARNCPRADGTAEGDGEFTVTGTFTNKIGDVTHSSTFTMSAKAKYKGKVGDDSFLDGPVTADIYYTYTMGPGPSVRIDPIAPAATHLAQHITIQFEVARGKVMDAPKITAFSGGDPTQGHLSQAYTIGTILSYFGGLWYTIAEGEWLTPGTCVQVVFDPPSFSRQPVPGSKVRVNAYVKTKGGEGVRGTFVEASTELEGLSHAVIEPTGESVESAGGNTDPGSPAIFYYTAPNKKLPHMGFGVSATSRGGNAKGVWETGLGTNWSGQITVTKISSRPDKNSDLTTEHSYGATRITIAVKDGVGKAHGFSEIHNYDENRHYVADGNGKSHIELVSAGSDDATADGEVDATVGIREDTVTHRYSVTVGFAASFPTTTRTTSDCTRGKCDTHSSPFSVEAILPGLGGVLSDLNHVSGSLDLGKAPAGFETTSGSYTYVATWDLSRIGTTK